MLSCFLEKNRNIFVTLQSYKGKIWFYGLTYIFKMSKHRIRDPVLF